MRKTGPTIAAQKRSPWRHRKQTTGTLLRRRFKIPWWLEVIILTISRTWGRNYFRWFLRRLYCALVLAIEFNSRNASFVGIEVRERRAFVWSAELFRSQGPHSFQMVQTSLWCFAILELLSCSGQNHPTRNTTGQKSRTLQIEYQKVNLQKPLSWEPLPCSSWTFGIALFKLLRWSRYCRAQRAGRVRRFRWWFPVRVISAVSSLFATEPICNETNQQNGEKSSCCLAENLLGTFRGQSMPLSVFLVINKLHWTKENQIQLYEHHQSNKRDSTRQR